MKQDRKSTSRSVNNWRTTDITRNWTRWSRGRRKNASIRRWTQPWSAAPQLLTIPCIRASVPISSWLPHHSITLPMRGTLHSVSDSSLLWIPIIYRVSCHFIAIKFNPHFTILSTFQNCSPSISEHFWLFFNFFFNISHFFIVPGWRLSN